MYVLLKMEKLFQDFIPPFKIIIKDFYQENYLTYIFKWWLNKNYLKEILLLLKVNPIKILKVKKTCIIYYLVGKIVFCCKHHTASIYRISFYIRYDYDYINDVIYAFAI